VLENERFGATADPKCDGRVNFRGMWDNVGIRAQTLLTSDVLGGIARPAARFTRQSDNFFDDARIGRSPTRLRTRGTAGPPQDASRCDRVW
jgi:hypothetical protein